MPIEQIFEEKRGLLLTRPVDPWTIDEVIEAMKERMTHVEYSPEHVILVDWQRARLPGVRELRRWVSFVERYEDRLPRRRALVLPASIASGIAGRLVMKFLESRGLDLAIFHDRTEALGWLGV